MKPFKYICCCKLCGTLTFHAQNTVADFESFVMILRLISSKCTNAKKGVTI